MVCCLSMYQSNLFTMGKDRNGKYHPPKGKPSGAGKNDDGLGVQATPPEKMEQYEEISARYTIDDDTLAPDVPMRHPNRNTQKGQSRFKNQQDAQDNVKGNAEKTTDEAAAVAVEAEELPGILSRELFTELAGYKSETCCISLYLPTNKAGVEVNEQTDAIRFKNSLQEVANRLQVKGWDQGRIKKLLEPGFNLVQQETFWTKLTPGLAVFIDDGYFKFIKMPMQPTEDLVIESTFYVTPLVPILTSNEEFYVVVISKKQVKLFRGDAFGMEFINVPGLANGLGNAPEVDSSETTFRLSEGGNGAAAYHGHGGGNNVDDKALIATSLEAADDVLWKEVLHDKTAPLLIAGVEYMIPIYKSVADYKYIWNDVLTGSYEYTDTQTLYAEARKKMQPLFEQKQQKALALYGNQSATALTSSIVADVVPAAYYGRIAHLFVERGAHIWGTFDEMANELQVHESEQEGSEHLIDNVVVKTLQTGGDVYLLDKAQMPAEAPLAAIMRY
jgi:hypothetical protein